MNTHILLLGVFLCSAAVNARHMDPVESLDTEPSNNNRAKDNGGERHRRKRYHMSYGYDYQPPANPFYQPYRRDYDRNQDLLPEIYRLLDEISAYIRRPPPPPPPPQPIYIPYAVPYPICNCESNNLVPKKAKPTITSRFPEMDDSNQNWGLEDPGIPEEEGDGSRPLNFIPKKPKRPMNRKTPSLDHGTQHARVPSSQEAAHVPDMCDVFSLSCCSADPAQQKKCFTESGCADIFNDKACDQTRLLKIIDEYSKAYAPTVN